MGKENKVKDSKKSQKNRRRLIVSIFTVLVIIIAFIIFRGRYLETLEIGEQYVDVFWKNVQYNAITIISIFILIYISLYITNNRIQSSLKQFFDDEKKAMPKLPNKSICFIVSIIASVVTSKFALNKIILFFNATSFGSADEVLGHDIGYYLFKQPLIEFSVIYLIVLLVALTIYAGIYYIVVLNTSFDGVRRETLKSSKFINQLLGNVKILSILIAVLSFVKTQNLSADKFLNIGDATTYSLYGAGFTDVNIKIWGYRILAIVIVISVFLAVSAYKKGKTKNVIKSILVVPIYLLTLFVTLIGYNYIVVEANELDKQKPYINYNIKYTRDAYNINIDEVDINNGGTITEKAISQNKQLLNNISIANEDIVLKYLNGTLTNKGYYIYTTTQIGEYMIDGTDTLVYVSPREILSSSSTYDNKTYEYTHGYGIVVTSAANTVTGGTLENIQKTVTDEKSPIKTVEPRIYFGKETNETVVTNSTTKQEFDYISSDVNNTITTNSYDGKAGLKLGLIDRIILATSKGDIKLAFSKDVNKDSKILTNRNILQRAKKVMPYLVYDENPYLVVNDQGKLVWVLDAYTISKEYPYSQKSIISSNYIEKTEFNYIRNSVKVIIDAYDGTTDFYITDRTDPVVMAYRNAYPTLFKDLDEKIPESISEHFVYPEYLYNAQANVLKRYHNVQADVLYRTDDVWDIATYTNGISENTAPTQVQPYYALIKTANKPENQLGLVLPYTPYGKQNITSYLVGTCENGTSNLTLYKFPADSNVLGLMQLDTQIEQNESIYKQIKSLEVTGTKITKNTVVIPIDDTLLYVEAIYQQYINEENSVPTLKKVVVASGNKVAIGDDFKSALANLASQYAINIEVETTDNVQDLITLIIRANKNLKESSSNSDWEMVGKDLTKLQDLIDQLEVVIQTENAKDAQ